MVLPNNRLSPQTSDNQTATAEESVRMIDSSWRQIGDFTTTDNTNPRILHTTSYINVAEDNLIRKIYFTQHRDNSFQVHITTSSSDSRSQILEQISQNGFPTLVQEEAELSYRLRINGPTEFSFETSDRSSLWSFISILNANNPSLSPIRNHILRYVAAISMHAAYLVDLQSNNTGREGPTPNLGIMLVIFDSLVRSISEPQEPILPGENEKKLDDLHASDSIPNKFKCALLSSIMDDPVSDPNQPEVKFDRRHIERRLGEKQENPFTRQALTPSQLVADTTLKAEIDAFVKNLEMRHQQPPVTPGYQRVRNSEVNSLLEEASLFVGELPAKRKRTK